MTMKPYKILLVVLFALAVTGCASIKVIPEQVANGIVNATDNSQTLVSNGVSVTARVSDTELNAYNLDSTVTAFHLAIKNNTAGEVAFDEFSFVAIDEKGVQYSLLTPEKVREIIKKDSYYLMPYPYVGFYYLEDYQKTSFYNRSTSSLPYFYELYPQDIFTRSLPFGAAIIPGMQIEGLIYYKLDISTLQGLKLYIYRKGASKASSPEFVFPFKIVK
jgi:hypothetical protein